MIPFCFYIFAKRYIYQLSIFNEYEENEYYEIKSLSPLMWTTKTTKFTAKDFDFPNQPEMAASFLINNQKFLWDRNAVR
jgi:hypothetical protein